MKQQEAFDDAVRGIIEQGGPSLAKIYSGCAYRGKDGCKCAIGHLIPDDLYLSKMEGKTVRSDFVRSALDPKYECDPRKPDDMVFLDDLQDLHDGTAIHVKWNAGNFMSKFRERAASFAALHGLDASVLERKQ